MCSQNAPQGTLGAVGCGDDIWRPCAWDNPVFGNDTNALGFIRECSLRHELEHIDERERYGSYCASYTDANENTGLMKTPNACAIKSELEAHKASAECLKKKIGQCLNLLTIEEQDACKLTMNYAIKKNQEKIDEYQKAYQEGLCKEYAESL